MDIRRAVAVGIGAMAGASIRWAATRTFGDESLNAVLLGVNVAGCLLLGLVSELPPPDLDSRTRALLGAGLCGTLTTWSGLAVQTATGLRAGTWLAASTWLCANIAVGLTAAVAGRHLGRRRWGADT